MYHKITEIGELCGMKNNIYINKNITTNNLTLTSLEIKF